MLGHTLQQELKGRGHSIVAPSSSELDITDPESLSQIPSDSLGIFDWCLNCAAYTAVDKAESESDLAFKVNALGPGYLAQMTKAAGIKLLHASTDFVFDGQKTTPYVEEDATSALGAYGRSKLEGERSVFSHDPNAVVCRTSWLFGPNGPSFPRTMIRAWEAGKTLRVVSDQCGTPTSTQQLSQLLADLVEKNAFPGVYHTAGSEIMTWHELAVHTIQAWLSYSARQEDVDIEKILTADWPTPAKRPPYSALASTHLLELNIDHKYSLKATLDWFCKELHSRREAGESL